MSLTAKPRVKSHHRKRQALHHRKSKTYLKPYWPYIPMLAIIGLGFVLNSVWLNNAQVLGANTDLSRGTLLQDTNIEREANHDSDLKFNADLETAAQNKANDLVKNNYWAHISPTGKTPWTWIIGSGYEYQAAGENLAYGFASSDAVITAWMNSPEHRANLLNTGYQDVGFGIAESANYIGEGPKVIVVAEYGTPLISVPIGVTTPTVSQPPSKPVSRLQILTGSSATWTELIVTALLGAAVASLLIKHGLYMRKLIFKGEALIVHHPLLDIAIVSFCTVGVLLMRTVGHIG